MRELDFDEIVTVLETGHTVELGVVGATGVILGKSQGADERIYAVLIGDETIMLPESVLVPTGRYIDPNEVYGGESIRVQAERYPEEGAESHEVSPATCRRDLTRYFNERSIWEGCVSSRGSRLEELRAQAEVGNVDAMLELAETSEIADQGRWLLRAAQAGSEQGRGKLAQFRPNLEEAAQRGDSASQGVLGGILLAWDENPSEAAMWFAKSAESGNNEARRSLGYLHVEGIGVDQDLAKAESLFLAAAREGDAIAAHNLGVFYVEETDSSRDSLEGIGWLRVAAEAGIDEAAAKLGDVLSGMDRDEEALYWYERAGDLGNTGAMMAAGCWHRDGTGTEENRIVAVKWFLRMLEFHNFEGVHEIFQLAPRMTDSEIREGGRLADRQAEAEKIIQMCNSGAGHGSTAGP
ncbi:tetratricopeptide repeat protein [Streptomyces sp. NPDC001982]|uniref:tetratricopeptide repeat protein n=1 Tax=Streptomyces sp. NPDC001982 TaxID=3154405 RepID=UPI0033220020